MQEPTDGQRYAVEQRMLAEAESALPERCQHRTEWRTRVFGELSLEHTIESLQLSARAFNCLVGEGIVTKQQLCSMTEIDLFKLPKMGKTSVRDTKNALSLAGLRLAWPGHLRVVSKEESRIWWDG